MDVYSTGLGIRLSFGKLRNFGGGLNTLTPPPFGTPLPRDNVAATDGVPTSEVGYTSATTGTGDNEVHKGHVVGALENNNNYRTYFNFLKFE
jgi:hypothetical protein